MAYRKALNWKDVSEVPELEQSFDTLWSAVKTFQTAAIKLGVDKFSYRDLSRGSVGLGFEDKPAPAPKAATVTELLGVPPAAPAIDPTVLATAIAQAMAVALAAQQQQQKQQPKANGKAK